MATTTEITNLVKTKDFKDWLKFNEVKQLLNKDDVFSIRYDDDAKRIRVALKEEQDDYGRPVELNLSLKTLAPIIELLHYHGLFMYEWAEGEDKKTGKKFQWLKIGLQPEYYRDFVNGNPRNRKEANYKIAQYAKMLKQQAEYQEFMLEEEVKTE